MRRVAQWCTLLAIAFLCVLPPQSSVIAQNTPQVPINRNIELQGSVKLPAMAQSVAVYGSYVYVALGSSGLAVIDISNSALPRLVKTLAAADGVYDIVIAGRFAYIIGVEGGEPGFERATKMQVLDLQNPINPREIGRYTISARGEGAPKLFLRGSYLFASVVEAVGVLASAGSTYPIDITDPQKLRVLPRCCPLAQDIALIDQYLYVLYMEDSFNRLVLDIFDISDISNIVTISTTAFSGSASKIEIVNDQAYIDGTGALHVLDIRQPEAPHEVSTLPISDTLRSASDSQLYFTNSVPAPDGQTFKGLIRIRDIDRLDNSVDVGTILLQDTYIYNLVINNDHIFALSSSTENDSRLSLLRYTGRSSLSGRVIDTTGKPLNGVKITTNSGQIATTNGDGIYSFATIPSGTIVFTATLAGYTFIPNRQLLDLPHDGVELWFTGLPAPVQTTVTSGSAAQLTFSDLQGTNVSVDVPSGTLSTTATLALTPTLLAGGAGLTPVGYGFEVSPLMLSKPISITIRYTDADVRAVTDETKLTLRWWNGTIWQDAAQSCGAGTLGQHDPTSNVFSMAVCATGRFSLVGPTQQVYLPHVIQRRLPAP